MPWMAAADFLDVAKFCSSRASADLSGISECCNLDVLLLNVGVPDGSGLYFMKYVNDKLLL